MKERLCAVKGSLQGADGANGIRFGLNTAEWREGKKRYAIF